MKTLALIGIVLTLAFHADAAAQEPAGVTELMTGQRIRVMGEGFGDQWHEGFVARISIGDEVCWGVNVGQVTGASGEAGTRVLFLRPSNTVEIMDEGSGAPAWLPVRLERVLEGANCSTS